MPDRKVGPHDFWLITCGIDTHRRGSEFARLDTPWNAFTQDGGKLVCTMWSDTIVKILDPLTGTVRQFIKMGGRSKRWVGVGKMHGTQAQENLEAAIAKRLPIFGYSADPMEAKLRSNIRTVKHFNLDVISQLKPWIGPSCLDLNERLKIDEEFKNQGLSGSEDHNLPPTLFELQIPSVEPPGFVLKTDRDEMDLVDDSELLQPNDGNLTDEEYAPIALSILIEHVLSQRDEVLQTLTYEDLAEKLGRKNKHGRPWAKGMGHLLGKVTGLIDQVSPQLPEPAPYLTTIVVSKAGPTAGLPDVGIKGRWPGYDTLSRKDKKAKVEHEYVQIMRYGTRWNDVLRLVGLPQFSAPPTRPFKGGMGGGESPEHHALKEYVLAHPEMFGAQTSWKAEPEFILRSLDAIDVMFRSEDVWIGVEVKSSVSERNISDYERGLYQVIKYKAVLEAQALIDRPKNPPKVHVYLALQKALPAQFRGVAHALGVECFENVSYPI